MISLELSLPSYRRHLTRPSDIREGIYNAATVITEGIEDTYESLSVAARREHAKKGLTGAVGGVLRQVPATIIRPAIFLSSASANVLEGIQGQVAPDLRKEEEQKWRPPNADF